MLLFYKKIITSYDFLSWELGMTTCCCPFITFGRNAEIIDRGRTSKLTTLYSFPLSYYSTITRKYNAITYYFPVMLLQLLYTLSIDVSNIFYAACASAGLIFYLLNCCAYMYSCTYRTKLRALYSLPEEPCKDCCVHYFCVCCALCQEYRELKNRGLDPAIGKLQHTYAFK